MQWIGTLPYRTRKVLAFLLSLIGAPLIYYDLWYLLLIHYGPYLFSALFVLLIFTAAGTSGWVAAIFWAAQGLRAQRGRLESAGESPREGGHSHRERRRWAGVLAPITTALWLGLVLFVQLLLLIPALQLGEIAPAPLSGLAWAPLSVIWICAFVIILWRSRRFVASDAGAGRGVGTNLAELTRVGKFSFLLMFLGVLVILFLGSCLLARGDSQGCVQNMRHQFQMFFATFLA